MTTFEKVAYLKGLADGLGLGKETKEEKLIYAIIDVLEAVSEDLDALEENALDLGDEIDAISDDLSDLEDIVYEDEYCCGNYDECFEDYEDDHCCGGHGHDDEGCCHGGEEHEHDGCCHGENDDGNEHEGCCHSHNGGHGHHHGGGCCHGHQGVMYEVTCPGCNNTITIDEEVLALGSIECPSCGGLLEFDLEGEEAEKE